MYSISVLVPAYNAEASIERSVRSLQQQTWTGDLEILVCDDGSTDKTAKIVTQLAASDARIRLVRNERNIGRPQTRSRLVQEARGAFIAWLDADDEKYPDMLRLQMNEFLKQRQKLQHSRFMVFTAYDWHFDEKQERYVVIPEAGKDPIKQLLEGTFGAYLWLTLAPKRVIELGTPFDPQLPRLQDLDFFIRCAGQGTQFFRISSKEPMCVYRKTDVGRDPAIVYSCFERIRKKHAFWVELYGADFRQKLVSKHLHVASRFAKANNDKGRRLYYDLISVIRKR